MCLHVVFFFCFEMSVTFDQDSLIASPLLTIDRLKATLLERVFTEPLVSPTSFSSLASVQIQTLCPGIASKTAVTTASTEIPVMQRKSMGHSRRKQGEHGALAL